MNIEVKKMNAATLSAEERARLEDVGFMTCMTLVMLGNYAQTGHFGAPSPTRPSTSPRICWVRSAAACAMTFAAPSIPSATSS